MKYLLIDGCTHKGNTWLVAEAAMNRIKKKEPESSFEMIRLIDEKLDYCIGCSSCFRKGADFCPHKAIMFKIIYKINDADALIMITTTYNARETALLKNFLDHMNYLLHRPQFFTKKALVITTVGGFGGKATIKSITGTLSGMGFNKCYGISIASISWNAYQITEKHHRIINLTTDRFITDVASGRQHYPQVLVLIPYNLFRGMSINFLPGATYETEDGNYYFNQKRVYDASVPLLPHHRLFGSIFYWIGRISAKFMVVTYKK